jgi:hypothetical protein
VYASGSPTPLHFGNAGRNILVGPGLFSWDFALLRDFRLMESKILEFRFEMFNLTNRPNFDFPENDLASPSFDFQHRPAIGRFGLGRSGRSTRNPTWLEVPMVAGSEQRRLAVR